jgi:hypothetical protein
MVLPVASHLAFLLCHLGLFLRLCRLGSSHLLPQLCGYGCHSRVDTRSRRRLPRASLLLLLLRHELLHRHELLLLLLLLLLHHHLLLLVVPQLGCGQAGRSHARGDSCQRPGTWCHAERPCMCSGLQRQWSGQWCQAVLQGLQRVVTGSRTLPQGLDPTDLLACVGAWTGAPLLRKHRSCVGGCTRALLLKQRRTQLTHAHMYLPVGELWGLCRCPWV